MKPVPLPVRPIEASATRAIPDEVLNAHKARFDDFLYARTWPARLDALNAWFTEEHGCNTDHLALLLTALLEQCAEEDIYTPEQAMLYRVSLNTAWREAAMRFLSGTSDVSVEWGHTYPAVMLFVMNRLGAEVLRSLN